MIYGMVRRPSRRRSEKRRMRCISDSTNLQDISPNKLPYRGRALGLEAGPVSLCIARGRGIFSPLPHPPCLSDQLHHLAKVLLQWRPLLLLPSQCQFLHHHFHLGTPITL